MRIWTTKEGNIASVGYDLKTQKLEVVFRTTPESVYTYNSITPLMFAEMVGVESLGSWFAKSIRPFAEKYPFTKSLNPDFQK